MGSPLRVRRMPNAPGLWILRDATGDLHVERITMRGATPVCADGVDVEPNRLHDWLGPIPGVPTEWLARGGGEHG